MSTWGTVYEMERAKATGNDPESLRREIERLRAEVASKSEQIGKLYKVCNERDVLRNALKPFAEIALEQDAEPTGLDHIAAADLAITPKQVRAARSALAFGEAAPAKSEEPK